MPAEYLLIVTLGKSETYKETIKEKSTILPYSIHKRIHVRPLSRDVSTVLVRVRVESSSAATRGSVRAAGATVQYEYCTVQYCAVL